MFHLGLISPVLRQEYENGANKTTVGPTGFHKSETSFIIRSFYHPLLRACRSAKPFSLILLTMLLLIQIVVTITLYPRKESAVFKCIFSKEAYSINFREGSACAAQIRRKTLSVSSVCPVFTVSALLSPFFILLRYNLKTYIYEFLTNMAFFYCKLTLSSLP